VRALDLRPRARATRVAVVAVRALDLRPVAHGVTLRPTIRALVPDTRATPLIPVGTL
jgi:hypothetical protein